MLTVLQVAYPLAPVSLDAVGGAEQVMAMLDRALVSAGHRSLAIACTGSRTAGILLPIRAAATLDEEARRRAHEDVRQRIRDALRQFDVDLIHMHGVDFCEYLPPAGIPVLATLHLPVSFYPQSIFSLERPRTWLNCVSKTQQETCPAPARPPVIGNGIPLDLFPQTSVSKQDYALALGRICPEKGFHLAAEAARQAGIPLLVAGAVFPYESHQRYFREQLLPLLQPPHRYAGPAGFTSKIQLLSGARCLLAPSLVAETSSLVAMEALACGTPVIAFPAGAIAELIEDGSTGFLVRDVGEMAKAIPRAAEIAGDNCVLAARSRFSADRMAERYFDLYSRIAGVRSPAPIP